MLYIKDILVVEAIIGLDLALTKGKHIRTKPGHVPTKNLHIHRELMKLYGKVTMCDDIIFVSRIPFLITRARHLNFDTVQHIDNTKILMLFKALVQVKTVYMKRDFKIIYIIIDGQFDPIRRP